MFTKKFVVEFEMTFDLDEDSIDMDDVENDEDVKALNKLTAEDLKRAIDAGFDAASWDFFGESICMLGLLTPKVKSVTKK